MIHSVLQAESAFYQSLDDQDALRFQQRIQDVLKGRDIRGKQRQEVSVESLIRLAEPAIRLTFHSDRYMFPSFNSVLIDGQRTYDELMERRYERDGRVTVHGALLVPEAALTQRLDATAFNPMMHQFAHALFYEEFMAGERILGWSKQQAIAWAVEHPGNPQRLPASLRAYVETHEQEVFACAMETWMAVEKTPLQMMPLR